MASIRREIPIDNDPDTVWQAVRDVGAVHERLVPGVLTDSVMDGDARVVTFANGMVVREIVVDLDDDARRFAYSVVDGPFSHHSAAMQVLADGDARSRLVWVSDLLPDELAPMVAGLVEEGADAMQRTLQR
jgi:hypothetical protein